jgi:hypothetical protein
MTRNLRIYLVVIAVILLVAFSLLAMSQNRSLFKITFRRCPN